jgi:uncharacterized Zn finger protein
LRVEVDVAYFERLGGLRVLARVRSGSELYGVYMWVKNGRVVVAGCTCPDHLVSGECEHIRMVYRLAMEKLGGLTTLELEN